MFQMIAYCDGPHGGIDHHSEDGICVVCEQLAYTTTMGFESCNWHDTHVYNSYQTCKTCKEKTCNVCCDETAWGVDISTNNYDCGKCPRCIVQGGGSTVVRD